MATLADKRVIMYMVENYGGEIYLKRFDRRVSDYNDGSSEWVWVYDGSVFDSNGLIKNPG